MLFKPKMFVVPMLLGSLLVPMQGLCQDQESTTMSVRGVEKINLDAWINTLNDVGNLKGENTLTLLNGHYMLRKSSSYVDFYQKLLAEVKGVDTNEKLLGLHDFLWKLRRVIPKSLNFFTQDRALDDVRKYQHLLALLAEDVAYVYHRRNSPSDSYEDEAESIIIDLSKKNKFELCEGEGRSALLNGVKVCHGDVFVTKGHKPSSTFLARLSDVPGAFSHSTIAQVKSGDISVYEALIEDGAMVRDARKRFGVDANRMKKFFVYRYNQKTDASEITTKLDRFYTEKKELPATGYDASFDSVTDKKWEKLYCSEAVAYVQNSKDGLDLGNDHPYTAYPTQNWGSVSGVMEDFFKEYFSVASERFIGPQDIEANKNYSVVSMSIAPYMLHSDRIHTAFIDSLIALAKEDRMKLNLYFQLLKGKGEDPFTDEDLMALQSNPIVSEKLQGQDLSKMLPKSLSKKQVMFFLMLDVLVGPKVREQVKLVLKERMNDMIIGRESLAKLTLKVTQVVLAELEKKAKEELAKQKAAKERP